MKKTTRDGVKETVVVLMLILVVTSAFFILSRGPNGKFYLRRINIMTGFAIFNPTVNLSLIDISLQSHFEEPCYVMISGYIQNTGSMDAENVMINCLIEDEYKNPLGMDVQMISIVKKDYVEAFLLKINSKCTKELPFYDCRVNCSNC